MRRWYFFESFFFASFLLEEFGSSDFETSTWKDGLNGFFSFRHEYWAKRSATTYSKIQKVQHYGSAIALCMCIIYIMAVVFFCLVWTWNFAHKKRMFSQHNSRFSRFDLPPKLASERNENGKRKAIHFCNNAKGISEEKYININDTIWNGREKKIRDNNRNERSVGNVKKWMKNVTSFSAPCKRHFVRCFRCFWLIIFDMILKMLHLVLIVARCVNQTMQSSMVSRCLCTLCWSFVCGPFFSLSSGWLLHSITRYRYFPCSRCFLTIFFINCFDRLKTVEKHCPRQCTKGPHSSSCALAHFRVCEFFKSTIDF